jgi:hypothetical protein
VSHKDAPPATAVQIAVEAFYTNLLKPQGVTVGWGRDKHGKFLASYARNAQAAWEAAQALHSTGDDARDAELYALLPGTYYMDPPDGGSPTLIEMLGKMAKDAARYRWLRDKSVKVQCGFYLSVGEALHKIRFEPQTVDNSIDAAITGAQGHE